MLTPSYFFISFRIEAWHFYQPSRTAYCSVGDDTGLAGETLLEEVAHQFVVRHVTQIDNHVSYIVVGAISLLQQRLYILPKALRLTLYILGEHDFTLVIDARRT